MGSALELEQRRRRFAVEADEPVRIVLQYEQLQLARQLGEAVTALRAERPPARILECGNRVEERRLPAASQRLRERIEVETLVVHRD